MVYFSLALVQVITLIIYLWGPEKLSFKPFKAIYRFFYLSSILVIPSFAFIFMGLISQYHINIPESIDASSMPVDKIIPGK